MLIIPAINCKNFKCVKERLEMAAEFLPRITDDNERKFGSGKSKNNIRKSVLRGLPSASGRNKSKRWVQIDISDGKFTKAKSWNNPAQLKESGIMKHEAGGINLEIHLMVNNVAKEIEKWCDVADRIIFHFENLDEVELSFIEKLKSKKGGPEFGIAITPKTPVEIIVPFLKDFKFVQLLAVNPGYSGGEFDRETLKKIKFIKKNYPKIVIEIDGGMNQKTAKLVKSAGADIINSASYIFDSKNPKEAYQRLSLV